MKMEECPLSNRFGLFYWCIRDQHKQQGYYMHFLWMGGQETGNRCESPGNKPRKEFWLPEDPVGPITAVRILSWPLMVL